METTTIYGNYYFLCSGFLCKRSFKLLSHPERLDSKCTTPHCMQQVTEVAKDSEIWKLGVSKVQQGALLLPIISVSPTHRVSPISQIGFKQCLQVVINVSAPYINLLKKWRA